MCSTQMQHTCSTNAAQMQHKCSTIAAQMQHKCCTHAQFVQVNHHQATHTSHICVVSAHEQTIPSTNAAQMQHKCCTNAQFVQVSHLQATHTSHICVASAHKTLHISFVSANDHQFAVHNSSIFAPFLRMITSVRRTIQAYLHLLCEWSSMCCA